MEIALQKEQSLQHGESIDQYMPTGNAIATMESIERQKLAEIAALNKNAADYNKKLKEIEQRAKQTKYKAMKNLNTSNEKVPRRVKEGMVRRASLQVPPQM